MDRNGHLLDVAGKTAVVTGASSGLGELFAEVLAARGARVVAAARRADRLDALVERLEDAGAPPSRCRAMSPSRTRWKRSSMRPAGGSAAWTSWSTTPAPRGTAGPTPERLPHQLFEHTVRVNLLGVWYGSQAAGRRMLADGRGGSIINVSSVLGLGGQQNYPPAYMATKAAVINLTRGLAVSWGDRGVRANVLAPGWFPSEMTEPYFAAPPFMNSILIQQPTGRVGELSELVGPLLFLASDASSYVSGHTLVVDGGMSASFGAPRHGQDVVDMFAAVIPDGLGTRITADAR